MANQPICKT